MWAGAFLPGGLCVNSPYNRPPVSFNGGTLEFNILAVNSAALTGTQFNLSIVMLFEVVIFLEPPLLIINMYLMPLFSESWWLLFYHYHYHYFCHKISKTHVIISWRVPPKPSHWNQSLTRSNKIKDFLRWCSLFKIAMGGKKTAQTSVQKGLSPQNHIPCRTFISSFNKYLSNFDRFPGGFLGTREPCHL